MDTALLVSVFFALFLSCFFLGTQANAAEGRVPARRRAEHERNARLLRFHL